MQDKACWTVLPCNYMAIPALKVHPLDGRSLDHLDDHRDHAGRQLRCQEAEAAAARAVGHARLILTPTLLYEGLKKTLGSNSTAEFFQPDRSAGSTLDTESIKQLSAN